MLKGFLSRNLSLLYVVQCNAFQRSHQHISSTSKALRYFILRGSASYSSQSGEALRYRGSLNAAEQLGPLPDQKTLFHQYINEKMKNGNEAKFNVRKSFGGISRGSNRGGGGGRRGYAGGRGGSRNGYEVSNSKDFSNGHLSDINWNSEVLTAVKKNFYLEKPSVSSRNQREIDSWMQINQVSIQGTNIPRPIFDFNEAGFPDELTSRLYKNFETPTVIQSISWPIAMSGRDIVSIAKTGSGKTLSFMLPAVVHTCHQVPRQRGEGPSVLILLPTRELAQQVREVSEEYCRALDLSLTCLFGGAPRGDQARSLSHGVDVIVATPGRLIDFLESGRTNLRRCSYLVLDEADRMLDMGFEPQIRKIVSQIRPDRQTLMFSATWPKEVRSLAADFQRNQAFLNVGSMELSANHNITQIVEVVEEHQKKERLLSILSHVTEESENKTLVFVETKRKADELTRMMRKDGWPVLCIHGDKNQNERDWVLKEFKSGKASILLATDVAARGLDVNDIKVVINYDYPNNSEDYVHRIGRTGRCDNKGTAYTLFTSANAKCARDLIKVMQEAKQNIPPQLMNCAFNGGIMSSGRNYRFGFKRSFSGTYGGSGPKKTRF